MTSEFGMLEVMHRRCITLAASSHNNPRCAVRRTTNKQPPMASRPACIAAGPRLFEQYTHVAVINNGMRGPFMPAGAATGGQHWAQPFLALLSNQVKLAGAYISCERTVHVQGPFQITDKCAHSPPVHRISLSQ